MTKIISDLEAIFFIRGNQSISLKELKSVLNESESKIKESAIYLQNKLDKDEESGLALKIFDNEYKMVTKPNSNDALENLYKNSNKLEIKLSASSLEVLTIIAYSQPITRIEVDFIRGVESSRIIQKLLALDLIDNKERSSKPGTPYLYTTTKYFLDHFNRSSLDNLPELANYVDQKQKEFSWDNVDMENEKDD